MTGRGWGRPEGVAAADGTGRRRGRRVIAVAAVLGVVLAGCGEPAPDRRTAHPRPAVAGGAATPNTVLVDLSRGLGRFPFELGRQLSAIPQTWRNGPATDTNLYRLGPVRIRVWLKFPDSYETASGTPRYDRWYTYLDTYHARAESLVVNWQTGYDPLVTRRGWSQARLLAAQRDMLAHYKRRYPKIQFIEVENEPADVRAYYSTYRLMYRAVAAVNALRLPGPRLQVGGPALDTFSPSRIGRFLDLYRADRTHGKRLDFVSYHQYLVTDEGAWYANKDNPAVVRTERARIDAMLRARGLPRLPVLVTETGAFPAGRQSNPPQGFHADLHIQAAGLAAIHYWYANQRDIVPLDWTIDHPENDRKDMFVDPKNGVPRPYFNAMLMFSMLPAMRYAATSNSLSPRGIGVYGMAGAIPSEVAVMTWNYQWTYQTGYESQVAVLHLPSAFRRSNVLVERFKIGADMHSGELARVERTVIPPIRDGSWSTPALPLRPNELRLLRLTPTTEPLAS